ncbi:hypothetical protein SASPL_104842 [Salvia splendens]|uniref:C2H2-type domain-containing protein n=1 Tax=Salvia splendens TaxID=180675 RepID=A0A8X8YK14_SALSN|nr:hypothetical protein SASPL_104842 [Salvia splendens]
MWSQFPTTMNHFRPPPFLEESLVWPPRSYPCTFCRRQFRSAQALGGHMNVHRRDRAKLKQSPPPPKSPPPINGGNCEETNCKRHKLCSSFSAKDQEIDLELRLGAPAVKLGHIL